MLAPRSSSAMRAGASKLSAQDFVDEQVGLPTVVDILAELAKPGRDPRSEFRVAAFAEGVNELDDLKPGMVLEGVITNVTHFGAFVDLGVHQDGLIHISELANTFVEGPQRGGRRRRRGAREGAASRPRPPPHRRFPKAGHGVRRAVAATPMSGGRSSQLSHC